MTSHRTTWIARIVSVTLSVVITASILGGIEQLSHRDMAIDSLMAQAAALAAAVRG